MFSVHFFGFILPDIKISFSAQTGTAVQWLLEAPTLTLVEGGRVREVGGRSDI